MNKLIKLGILILIVTGLINAILINSNIGGIVRELVRLTIVAGLATIVFGLLHKRKKSK